MQFALVDLKEKEPWLRNYHSKMLQMVANKMDNARKTLTALGRNGYRVGKLRYLTQEAYNSFTYNQSGFKITKHGNTYLLWLSKIGYIEIRLHRKPENIKQITVVRQVGKWYAIVSCGIAKPLFQLTDVRKSVGIDVGITKFAHDSDNHEIENPLFLTKMMKPLRRARRKLSRRQKESRNYQKAKSRFQILHERIRNKRLDFLHKASNYYSKKYDVIFLERLRTQNMVKNHSMACHILDSGWRTFKQLLEYKGKMVVEVEPYNTSISCSRCGNNVPKSLALRIHRCNRCGLMIDRDYNASLNIKQKGLQLLMGYEEVTPAKILCESMKQEQAIDYSIASPLICEENSTGRAGRSACRSSPPVQ